MRKRKAGFWFRVRHADGGCGKPYGWYAFFDDQPVGTVERYGHIWKAYKFDADKDTSYLLGDTREQAAERLWTQVQASMCVTSKPL